MSIGIHIYMRPKDAITNESSMTRLEELLLSEKELTWTLAQAKDWCSKKDKKTIAFLRKCLREKQQQIIDLEQTIAEINANTQ